MAIYFMIVCRKVFLFLVLVFLFGTFIQTNAFAHSGGTDSKGGHTNHSTGEYHYHHGYSAHQHSDLDGDGDLDCPYDFKVNVEQRQSSSESSYSSRSFSTPVPAVTPKPIPATVPKPTPYPQTFGEEDNLGEGNTYIVIATAVACVIFCSAIAKGCKKEKKNQEEQEKRNALFAEMHLGKNPIDCCNAPPGKFVSQDGYPSGSGSGKWGREYTFYVSARGTKYHCKKGCSGANIEINAVNIRGRQPCLRCNPPASGLKKGRGRNYGI